MVNGPKKKKITSSGINYNDVSWVRRICTVYFSERSEMQKLLHMLTWFSLKKKKPYMCACMSLHCVCAHVCFPWAAAWQAVGFLHPTIRFGSFSSSPTEGGALGPGIPLGRERRKGRYWLAFVFVWLFLNFQPARAVWTMRENKLCVKVSLCFWAQTQRQPSGFHNKRY